MIEVHFSQDYVFKFNDLWEEFLKGKAGRSMPFPQDPIVFHHNLPANRHGRWVHAEFCLFMDEHEFPYLRMQ